VHDPAFLRELVAALAPIIKAVPQNNGQTGPTTGVGPRTDHGSRG
jgi:hypothetical protein